jgi:hypothetical protein
MMTRLECLRINTAKVSYESIDGETLIINLENGNYYSLAGTAAEIWSIVERGASVCDILEALDQRYMGDRADIEQAVGNLVTDLQNEGLILTDPAAVREQAADHRPGTPRDPGDRRAFEAPVLSKFTDMQDLLLLDPIHEVDESGWPAPKASRED